MRKPSGGYRGSSGLKVLMRFARALARRLGLVVAGGFNRYAHSAGHGSAISGLRSLVSYLVESYYMGGGAWEPP